MQIREFRSKFAAKWFLHVRETLLNQLAHSGKREWKIDSNAEKKNRKAFWSPFSYSATTIMQIRDFRSRFAAKWVLQVSGIVFSLGTVLWKRRVLRTHLCSCEPLACAQRCKFWSAGRLHSTATLLSKPFHFAMSGKRGNLKEHVLEAKFLEKKNFLKNGLIYCPDNKSDVKSLQKEKSCPNMVSFG